jgi:enoyl-CoA hydratase/carnithine racemase
LDAAVAREWGLVNLVVDDDVLTAQAMAYAQALAKHNPESMAAMKSLARAGLDETLAEGLARESACVVDALRSENVSEGLAAFGARREPKFK